MTPTWRPDGAAVIAAADLHGGPFNLYEFSVDASASPRQLTRMPGGATWPDVSADGRTIVFVGYTPDGFDLFQMPYPGSTSASTSLVAPDFSPAPASALAATDDLPIAQPRGLAQKRFKVAQQHRKHKPEAAPAHDLLAEERNGPLLGFEGRAQKFGFGLEQLVG